MILPVVLGAGLVYLALKGSKPVWNLVPQDEGGPAEMHDGVGLVVEHFEMRERRNVPAEIVGIDSVTPGTYTLLLGRGDGAAAPAGYEPGRFLETTREFFKVRA